MAAKPRVLSYGLIRFGETKDGNLSLVSDVDIRPTTDPAMSDKIKALVAGLNYAYMNDPNAIEQLGQAYITGYTDAMIKEEESSKQPMGFHT